MSHPCTLEKLSFDNSYARLPEAFYAKLNPTPFSEPPHLVSFNPAAAKLIDLYPEQATRPEFAAVFGGSMLAPGMEPLAMLYSGHQFGVYVPQLGDGRAILLGEVRNERGERWDLHLKGAGLTPFSREGDGRAVLRSTIREYLCSEAMHGLGIPTTRGLCIVGSDHQVYREQVETGAMLMCSSENGSSSLRWIGNCRTGIGSRLPGGGSKSSGFKTRHSLHFFTSMLAAEVLIRGRRRFMAE